MKSDREKNWNGMNWIRQEKRLAIYLRDGLACLYCGTAVEHGAALQLDHVKPVEAGGSNDAANLATCCERCNKAKGARGVIEFIDATAAYIGSARVGVDGADIYDNLHEALKRPLPMAEAKAMIATRGSAARVLAAHREERLA